MSLQKTRPLESLQHVLTAFKQFEKKLDKLQDDVNYHGQTLTDLRIMVSNLTGPGEFENLEGKNDIPKGPSRKTTAIQYEYNKPLKVKRKAGIQPLPNNIKAMSFQGQKYGMRMSDMEQPFLSKMSSSPWTTKHSVRPSKGDAPRKATTLRPQKTKIEKKRSKPKK